MSRLSPLHRLFSFGLTKRAFNGLLPGWLRRKLTKVLQLDTGPFNRPIEGVYTIPIQEDAYLVVYWKEAYWKGGTVVGPGASLYVLQNEILRFDCAVEGRGHYHSLPCLIDKRDRIFFEENTVEDQINRSVRELTTNVAEHLSKHFRRSLRCFHLDAERLAEVGEKMREKMLIYYREAQF